jgi:hypothetical protein
MKTLTTILLSLIFPVLCISQTADSLRKDGKLEAAITAYKTAHVKKSKDWKNTYDLACAYALLFQKDSAFHYLSIALKDDTSLWALADSDLYSLIDDQRWKHIENDQMIRFQNHNTKIEEPEYAKKLLQIIMKDQALDYYIDQAKKQYMKDGNAPHWYYPLGAFKQQIAKENYADITSLIATYGWPTYAMVGQLAADAPLLVINHHESEEVRKKFLPLIKKSCEDREGSCMEYAKIQDRILVNEGKLQIYGMQFRYNEQRNLEPFPIANPQYVDQRRETIGLESLKLYLKRKINYNWTITQKEK